MEINGFICFKCPLCTRERAAHKLYKCYIDNVMEYEVFIIKFHVIMYKSFNTVSLLDII